MIIKNTSGDVIFEGYDLRHANLVDADLRWADLRYVNLYGADLRGADLYGADLRDAKLPDTDAVMASPWGWAHIQRAYIRIGCQYHPTDVWELFTDHEINKMATGALDWWKRWKDAVVLISKKCESYTKEDK